MDEVALWLLTSWQFWAAAVFSFGWLTYAVLRRRSEEPRPWWKKKRWVTALALWVAVAYPLSAGPATYCQVRGWFPWELNNAAYAPLALAVRTSSGLTRTLKSYVEWWLRLAQEHRYGPSD